MQNLNPYSNIILYTLGVRVYLCKILFLRADTSSIFFYLSTCHLQTFFSSGQTVP
jgi:hypothetical protein